MIAISASSSNVGARWAPSPFLIHLPNLKNGSSEPTISSLVSNSCSLKESIKKVNSRERGVTRASLEYFAP